MASLIDILVSGIRKSDGTVADSGTVMFYEPGTSVQRAVYSDEDGETVYTQPITLDADGTKRVYTDGPVRMIVNDSDGNQIVDVARVGSETDNEVEVTHDSYTGPTLYDSLEAAKTSLGGGDFKYLVTTGQTEMYVKDWMNQAFYNVKGFGAKGDNATDDAAAIQAAINHVDGLSYNGVVFFPPGVYRVSSALTLTAAGTSLQGSGAASTYIRSTSATGNCLDIDGVSDVFIRELTVDNSSTSTGHGIDVATSSRLYIDRVTVDDHLQSIVLHISASDHDIFINGCYLDFTSDASGYGVEIDGVLAGNVGGNIHVIDSYIGEHGAGAAGVCIYALNSGNTSMYMIDIRGNRFGSCDTVMHFEAGVGDIQGVTIVGNGFLSTPTTAHIYTGSNDGISEWGNFAGTPLTYVGEPLRHLIANPCQMQAPIGHAPENYTDWTTKTCVGVVAPNRGSGNIVRYDMTEDIGGVGGAGTIHAPADVPNATYDIGTMLYFMMKNTSGGNITRADIAAAFAVDYRVNTTGADIANGRCCSFPVMWDGLLWRQVAAEADTATA